ncbi:PREDICTED: uncharacterized protein LOC108374594, partial [Rhagoletis zephyria]|uniref:uncharacterized protein LOC108374594 n=1 Tax=Rhagoletis zephyria TaxID=28612 RepID=UPI0008118EC8
RASSPNYSGVSLFSATNATSRFKTKAAMKGYENTHVDLTICKELGIKSPAVCKLTELAEIALGNEKSNSPEFTSLSNEQEGSIFRAVTSREYITSSAAVDHPKNCGGGNDERIKSKEAHSSTSSKTIMHSSKIKSAVEDNSKEACRKIVIPERPFKNIGLEEKETITFQKPKTTINFLTDDNSISTTSYSDRDDFDFASLSCDEELSPKPSIERNVKNNSDSSSSRASAKTFENKSLIMDRIFKNMGTKAKTSIKVQSIGIQKGSSPKADINQLFDELRGDCEAKVKTSESVPKKHTSLISPENVKVKQRQQPSQTESPSSSKRGSRETRKKSNASAKSQKEISRLQSELGMSQEEIVKLINEGQRKSKRRCATNRPKKLVEMWSSDEYEEFLSTKDIIALIEEKEKQETRKKRKSANQLSTCSNKNKVIEPPKLIPSRRKSVRCLVDKDERLLGGPAGAEKSRGRKHSDFKEIVNNVKTLKWEPCTSVVVNKKHTSNNNNNQCYKNRRKNQSNQSSPRRKRLASEKLYYWSSSSDEDFGKINSTCEQELDGGEQYQKHGWIVGDSHKKLVTLLAIAKGNKKVDNSCGVKKNVSRKKN